MYTYKSNVAEEWIYEPDDLVAATALVERCMAPRLMSCRGKDGSNVPMYFFFFFCFLYASCSKFPL